MGETKFKEANKQFNKEASSWFNGIKNTDDYQSLSDEDKEKLIRKKKREIKDSILQEFGFKEKGISAGISTGIGFNIDVPSI